MPRVAATGYLFPRSSSKRARSAAVRSKRPRKRCIRQGPIPIRVARCSSETRSTPAIWNCRSGHVASGRLWWNLRVTDSLPEHPPAILHADVAAAGPPSVVQAAAILTWIGATGTAALTVLMTVAWLWVAAPVFAAFDSGPDNPRWWLIGFAVAVLALSAAAAVLAFRVWQGERWAWWGLLVLSALAAFAGVITAYAVIPLLVAALAMAAFVLLLLSDSRAWAGVSN
jgi:hypothetical protein